MLGRDDFEITQEEVVAAIEHEVQNASLDLNQVANYLAAFSHNMAVAGGMLSIITKDEIATGVRKQYGQATKLITVCMVGGQSWTQFPPRHFEASKLCDCKLILDYFGVTLG